MIKRGIHPSRPNFRILRVWQAGREADFNHHASCQVHFNGGRKNGGEGDGVEGILGGLHGGHSWCNHHCRSWCPGRDFIFRTGGTWSSIFFFKKSPFIALHLVEVRIYEAGLEDKLNSLPLQFLELERAFWFLGSHDWPGGFLGRIWVGWVNNTTTRKEFFLYIII